MLYKGPHFNEHSLSLFCLVLKASASPAEELKLVPILVHTVRGGSHKDKLIMTARIFQFIFLLHFLLFKPFPYIPLWYQQPSRQETFRNSCFTHEETRAQEKLYNFLGSHNQAVHPSSE